MEPSTEVLRYFHPILPSGKLRRRPVQSQVAGRKYALFRDSTGRAAALDDACPHRRAPLSQGRVRADGRLACPYHGWNFDAQGRGRSPSCPDLTHCDTRSYQVVERFQYLWLAHRETPLSAFPSLGVDGFEFAGSLSTLFPAPMDVALDNISEDEHFPFIHTTFGWHADEAAAVSIETSRFDDRTAVRLTGRQRPSLWAPLGGIRSRDRFQNEWQTRFDPVHAVYTFGWQAPDSGQPRPVTTRAAVFLVPETAISTRAHMFLFVAIAPSFQRRIRPVIHWLARHIAGMELERDARLTGLVSQASSTLRGMRLSRFDQALIHNRRLLRTLYWGTGVRQKGRSGRVEAGAAEAGAVHDAPARGDE
jgi:phenylpropionate dioxygenase-like ring-hydroxylating dioxygenase large terminal subunit